MPAGSGTTDTNNRYGRRLEAPVHCRPGHDWENARRRDGGSEPVTNRHQTRHPAWPGTSTPAKHNGAQGDRQRRRPVGAVIELPSFPCRHAAAVRERAKQRTRGTHLHKLAGRRSAARGVLVRPLT